MSNTATYLGVPPKMRSDARLYRMEPPMEHWRFVVASATTVMGEPETYLFGADELGVIQSWSELPDSQRGTLSHEQVLEDAGYTVVVP